MFNGQFGQIRFGLQSTEETEIEVFADFSDSLRNVSGFGLSIAVDESMYDSLMCKVKVTPSVAISFGASSSLKGTFVVIGGIVVESQFGGVLGAKSSASKDVVSNLDVTADVSANVYIGKDILLGEADAGAVSFADTIANISNACKDLVAEHIITDILGSVVSVVILDSEPITLALTIPAHGRLEIKSDTYDVILNGENALHLHSGGWILLDRDIELIVIDSGTGGNLDTTMIYNERYL